MSNDQLQSIMALVRGYGIAMLSRDTREANADRLKAIEVAIREAIAAPGVAQGWKPITTAPMFGEPVLLWWRFAGAMRGRFVNDQSGDGWMCDGDQILPINQADCTHWMPLPAAPSPTAEQPPVHDKAQLKRLVTQVFGEDYGISKAPERVALTPLTDQELKDVLWKAHKRWMEAADLDTEGMIPGEWLDHWVFYVRAVEAEYGIGLPAAGRGEG